MQQIWIIAFYQIVIELKCDDDIKYCWNLYFEDVVYLCWKDEIKIKFEKCPLQGPILIVLKITTSSVSYSFVRRSSKKLL